MPSENTLKAALDLAERGCPVFPCRADKAPACPSGFKAANRNPVAVRALFTKYPGPLIGVPTGETSNFDALDIDTRHGGMDWLWSNRHRIPLTRSHETRSGGLHLLFRHLPGLRCSAGKIAPGVDVRADGGFVVWWPAAGMRVVKTNPIASWPDWLREALQPPPIRPQSAVARLPDDRMLAGLIRKVSNAPDGERNHMAFWAACRMGEFVRAGGIGAQTAIALIREAAIRAGLPALEAERTAASGVAAGRGG